MKSRSIPLFSLLVILLLIGSIGYPGTFAPPYSESDSSYAITHESTDSFNETVESSSLRTANPTPVEDLSPNAQRAFKQAKEQPTIESDGWQQLGQVNICANFVLICNEYSEPPDFPSEMTRTEEVEVEGLMMDRTERYGVVENNGDVYLTRTADATFFTGPSLDEMGILLYKTFLLGLYSVFLILLLKFHYSTHPNQIRSFAKGGFGIVVASFAYPYVMMFTSLSFALGAIVLWFVTLGLVLYGILDIYTKRKRAIEMLNRVARQSNRSVVML